MSDIIKTEEQFNDLMLPEQQGIIADLRDAVAKELMVSIVQSDNGFLNIHTLTQDEVYEANTWDYMSAIALLKAFGYDAYGMRN